MVLQSPSSYAHFPEAGCLPGATGETESDKYLRLHFLCSPASYPQAGFAESLRTGYRAAFGCPVQKYCLGQLHFSPADLGWELHHPLCPMTSYTFHKHLQLTRGHVTCLQVNAIQCFPSPGETTGY